MFDGPRRLNVSSRLKSLDNCRIEQEEKFSVSVQLRRQENDRNKACLMEHQASFGRHRCSGPRQVEVPRTALSACSYSLQARRHC